jgi:hypothetical protein
MGELVAGDVGLLDKLVSGGLRHRHRMGKIFMACLSIIRDGGPATIAANPIFLLDPIDPRGDTEFRFEVFEADAGDLKSLVGDHRCFYIDSTSEVFWAKLKSLEPCMSSHRGLAQLRDKPTLRGVLMIVKEPPRRQ